MFLKQEENRSIWSLSSDSESSADAQPVKKDKTTNGGLSASKDLATEDKKENNDTLLDHDGESPKNQASKVKSPMKKLEKQDERTSKNKNINSCINGGKEPKFGF